MKTTVSLSQFIAAITLAIAAGCPRPALAAVSVAGLYEAVVAGEGGESGRAAAAVDALRLVVVRLTGQRAAAAEPALAAVYADARRYVQTFRTVPGGQVAVGFDGAAIEAALLGAGLRLWSRDRPLTLVVVVGDHAGGSRSLAGSVAPELRQELERTAQLRGLPIVWAGNLEPALEETAIADGLAGRLEPLRELAKRYAADGVLLGRATAAGMAWSWLGPAGSGSAVGAAGEAVHALADRYGAQFAVAAASRGRLLVAVAGVKDLAGYAAALAALAAIANVESVDLEEVAGERLRLRVAFGGEPDALRQAVAHSGRLLPDDAAAPDGALHLVLQP